MAEWHSLLACPVCGADLAEASGAIRCASGHSFDIARQGYVNLLPGGAAAGTADTQEMVAARAAFLARGHFKPIDAALADATERAVAGRAGCIVDVGAGTGEHLAAVLDRMPGRAGLALDVSKYALRRASRAHPRIGAVVCDAWSALPVRSGAAAAVISVFAPRNAAEFARILSPAGSVVVVTPSVRHLAELVAATAMVSVDPQKDERLAATLGEYFRRQSASSVEGEVLLSRDDAAAAVRMGPSAHHVTAAEVQERVAVLEEPVRTALSVNVSVWTRIGE